MALRTANTAIRRRTNERAYLALAAQLDAKVTVLQVGTDNLWLLSERGQHLLSEAISYDHGHRAASPGPQFIKSANGDEFPVANHAHLSTELFGLGQVV